MKLSLDDKVEPGSELRRGQYSLRSLFVLTTLVAVVCGLVEWHGIGVLVVILWNAVAVLIALAVGRKKRKAAAASLFSLFAGWSVAFVWLWLEMRPTLFETPKFLNAIDALLLWTSIPTFLGWLLLAVPAIALARVGGLLYRPWFTPIVGTGLGLLACAIFVCASATPRFYTGGRWWALYVSFAVVVGALGGALFPWLVRIRCPTYLLSSMPSILFLSFWCLLWPALESLTPDLTFAYGTEDARVRSLHRVFQSIEAGSSVTEEDIYRRFPVLRFSVIYGGPHLQPTGCGEMGLSWTTERYDYSCHIHVDPETGRITDVSSELREHRPWARRVKFSA